MSAEKGGMSKSKMGLWSLQSGWNGEYRKNREDRDQGQGQTCEIPKRIKGQKLELGTGM